MSTIMLSQKKILLLRRSHIETPPPEKLKYLYSTHISMSTLTGKSFYFLQTYSNIIVF